MSIFVDLLDVQGYLLDGPAQSAHVVCAPCTPDDTHAAKALVRQFLTVVRSGQAPERVREFLADRVIAHQVESEQPRDVVRTPEDYAEHVREFTHQYGQFEFEIVDLIADGDRVYARWIQRGRHLITLDGEAPTGKPLVEYASAVYRVEAGKIHEYWIQIDRMGMQRQVQPSL